MESTFHVVVPKQGKGTCPSSSRWALLCLAPELAPAGNCLQKGGGDGSLWGFGSSLSLLLESVSVRACVCLCVSVCVCVCLCVSGHVFQGVSVRSCARVHVCVRKCK